MRESIYNLLHQFSGIEPLKRLCWSELNYDRVDRPLSRRDWSDGEREVLAGMAEGRSNQSIAAKLHISNKTVEACTGRIFTKLGLEPGPDDHRRVRAVLTHLKATDKY